MRRGSRGSGSTRWIRLFDVVEAIISFIEDISMTGEIECAKAALDFNACILRSSKDHTRAVVC